MPGGGAAPSYPGAGVPQSGQQPPYGSYQSAPMQGGPPAPSMQPMQMGQHPAHLLQPGQQQTHRRGRKTVSLMDLSPSIQFQIQVRRWREIP